MGKFHKFAKNKIPGKNRGFSACRKALFDTLADRKKVRKTSNSHPSAYIGTVGCELRSKSKSLKNKRFFVEKERKSKIVRKVQNNENSKNVNQILTVTDFFDGLK